MKEKEDQLIVTGISANWYRYYGNQCGIVPQKVRDRSTSISSSYKPWGDNSDLPKQGYTGASSTNTGVITYFVKLDLRLLHEMEPLSDNGRRAKNLRLDSWSLA